MRVKRRLDSVIRYRQQVEKQLAAELSEVERELRHGELQVLEERQLLDATQARYRNEQDTAISRDGFERNAQHFYTFATRLTSDIQTLQAHADDVRERYEQKHAEWAVAARDRKAVEMLVDKQKREERAWIAKQEAQHLDDVAQRQYYYDTLMLRTRSKIA